MGSTPQVPPWSVAVRRGISGRDAAQQPGCWPLAYTWRSVAPTKLAAGARYSVFRHDRPVRPKIQTQNATHAAAFRPTKDPAAPATRELRNKGVMPAIATK